MIAIAERPAKAVFPLAPPALEGAAAQTLALAFLRYASACWRGEEGAARFATRLSAYWRTDLPPMPVAAPDAFSPHGAGGRGIAWYETADAVLGYIPGRRRGYRVPLDAVPGLARRVPAGPGARPGSHVDALQEASRRFPCRGAAA